MRMQGIKLLSLFLTASTMRAKFSSPRATSDRFLGTCQEIIRFLQERTGESLAPLPRPNPLLVYDDIRLRLLYLRALFEADIVFPAMLVALGNGCRIEESLRLALDYLLGQVDQGLRLDEVSEALYQLRERIGKIRASGSGTSTETPVDKAQRVPRLEFCVDLGLLDRKTSPTTEAGESNYHVTTDLKRAPWVLRDLVGKPGRSRTWLDREFFRAAGARGQGSSRTRH
jgi:hypothetical protein